MRPWAGGGVLACSVLASWAAAAADIAVFEHDNFEGRRLEAHAAVADFARLGFNDRASSVVIRRGLWQLCTHAQYRGRCETFGPGRYASLNELQFNDRVSSLRPVDREQGGHRGDLVLFRHDNFGGRSVAIDGAEGNFGHFGLNDEVSSVVIERGRWVLCTDAGFEGECVTLGPGSYPSLTAYGLNDTLSSARPARHREGRGSPWPGGGGVHAWPGSGDYGPSAARAACARALGDTIGREQRGVSRIELFDGEIEEFRASDDEIGVRGAGQYETRRALTPFRFRCRWHMHSGEVTSLNYRD